MEQKDYKTLSTLTNQPNYARNIATLLNTNHMQIQRSLKKLEENNIIDYDQIGKTKLYHIKNSLEAIQALQIMEKYKLIELLTLHPRFRKICENILENKNIKLAIVFGSYAKKTNTKTSDIDIYINTSNKQIKKDIENIDSKISVKFGEFDENNLLVKEISKNHIILKGVEEYYELINYKIN